MEWYWIVSLALMGVSVLLVSIGVGLTVRDWIRRQWKPVSPTFYLDCAIFSLLAIPVVVVLCLVAMVLCIVFV